MKDYLDNDLHIGDKIVYCRATGSGFDLIKTEVMGFSEKMVKIPCEWNWRNKEYMTVAPHNCIIYSQS